MRGAIFFSGRYGSTEQYAKWISEATGLPIFDIEDTNADPAEYEYLILGSSIVYFRLTNRKWVKANLDKLKGRSKVLFSVSGAGPSTKLNRWVKASLPPWLLSQMEHVPLGGKLDHTKVSWWIRLMLWIGSLFNPDRQARKEERSGFDHMDKSSIEPIVKLIRQYEAMQATA